MIIDADYYISSHKFDTLGADRLCFCSDMPFLLMHVELAKYRAILRDHSEAERDKILGGNLAQLLGLPAD